MKNGQTVIALSPVPEVLCLAARCSWDDLRAAGRKRISWVLDAWARQGDIATAIVLLSEVVDPQAVRERLERLGKNGTNVQWFTWAGAESVKKACARLRNVQLIQAETLDAAFDKVFAPEDGEPTCADTDLRDYLRYKITLSLMQSLDPEPLKQAIDTIRKKPFRVPAGDRESLEHFREADFPYLEGQSKIVTDLKTRIVKIAPTDMSVLILGETGTGKEAVAFYLHEFSRRRSKPFVSINCAGLEENFLRSELFGHRKGAFTGALEERKGLVERARGGTLFLDELGEMPRPIQADLLRFLETRRYRRMGEDKDSTADIRVVAAAQPALKEKIASGKFRLDLFYRIAQVEVETPSLADVPEDIIRIVRHIVYTCDAPDVSREKVEEAIRYFHQGERILRQRPWPGNVRELAKYVRRKMLLGDDVLGELKQEASVQPAKSTDVPGLEGIQNVRDIRPLNEVIAAYVQRVFEDRGELTQKQVAERLGISVNTLKKHLRRDY